jgi:hypothetical protein
MQYNIFIILLYLCIDKNNNLKIIKMVLKEKKKSVLLLKVNDDVYAKFKYFCIENNYTMTGYLNYLIREAVKEQK